MKMVVDLGAGSSHLIDTPTSIDCGRQMSIRRSLRSFVECMVIPCCGFPPPSSASSDAGDNNFVLDSCSTSTYHITSTVTATFFGFRKGRVSFCIQEDARSTPLVLLEFAVPTAYLAREMQHGYLRIALECQRRRRRSSNESDHEKQSYLLKEPVWTMYCNGRKVGFAIRRLMTANDARVLMLMQSVSVGAGVLPDSPNNNKSADHHRELMYLRASFQRVIGSTDSESFHIVNPVGCSDQDLSIFFLRSP